MKRFNIRCLAVFLLSFVSFKSNAVTVTYESHGFEITTTWDDSLACQGSTTTILYNVKRVNDNQPNEDDYRLLGFVPIGNGFACQTVTPPIEGGYEPGGFFDPTDEPEDVGEDCSAHCNDANLGVWQFAKPFPAVTTGFDMEVTVTLTECGTLTFFACFQQLDEDAEEAEFTECIVPNGISFYVVPHVELTDIVAGPVCEGTIFTGILPPPICTGQSGFDCPECVSCTACDGFTFTTAATACIQCSGISGCICPCTLCSGFTGCPPCTACAPCPDCEACSSFTGPCGPQPSHYVVGGAVGGSVNLIDITGGLFEFIPNANFFGAASFEYNMVSDWNPIVFCPAVFPAVYQILYAQNPDAGPGLATGCAGTGLIGSLIPFVTGGSGSYTFNQFGPVSCGSVTVNPDGSFLYTAPTGPATTCEFGYVATDTAFPNCVGTGIVTVVVNELPTAVSDTINTCLNQSVMGTVTATGGLAPYTFDIITSTTNGTLTEAPDFLTSGNFTYEPATGFIGTDSFTFAVTDSNGCTSDPVGIIIINVNPVPVAGSTAINGCVNTLLTGYLGTLVTGGTGPFAFSQGDTPPCGGIFITPDGIFTFAPNFGFTGECCFDYFVSQGGCPATAPGQVCITVEPGPIATGSEFDVCPSGQVTGNLNDNIIVATPPVSFVLVSTFGGIMLSFDPMTGDYEFLTTIESGMAGFQFRVDDAFPCLSAIQTVLIDVHPRPVTVTGTLQGCDNAPIVGNLNPNVMGDSPFIFTGPLSQAGGTTVITPSGIFTFTPNVGVTGGSFTYEVASAFGCTGSGTQILIIHPAPDATGATVTGCAQTKLSGDLTPLVSGGTPPYVSFQLAGVPMNGSAMVSSTGIFMFTPNAGVSSGSFNYQVTDSNGCMDIATINVAVNPGPTAATGVFTGCDNGVEGDLIDLVSGVGPFTFSAPVGPVFNGTVILLDVNQGTFLFLPTFPAPTQGSFNYQVTDSSVPPCTSRPTPVFVNIIEGPEAGPASFTGCENQPFSGSLTPFVTGGIPPYAFSFTGAIPTCASSIVITPDGEVIFVPALDFTGPCTFGYCVTDTVPCDSCSNVTINVQPSPVATNSGPFTGCANNPFSGDLNDFMASGTPPFSFTGGNEVNGILDLLVTGPFNFTPLSIGFASFDYSAIDFNGCQSNTGTISVNAQESPLIGGTSPLDTCQDVPVSGFVEASASIGLFPLTFSVVPGSEVGGTMAVMQISENSADFTFTPTVMNFPTPTVNGGATIRVTASNGCYADFPVTVFIHQSPIAGNTGLGSCSPVFTGSLTGLVSGGIPPYSFSQFNGFIPPDCGTVIINPDGSFVFTAGGTGPCTFFYEVTESSTGTCSSTGAVTIITSTPPEVDDFVTCACFNVPVTINLNTLTTGGVPPYTFAIVGTPVGGVVFLNPISGLATFRPNPGFTGIGSFQFQAFDSFNPSCASNIGTVTIPVPCC
ncbi:MAG: hypothetical protein AMXMBFR12_04980 [Candidatus Babeliales bacterium]